MISVYGVYGVTEQSKYSAVGMNWSLVDRLVYQSLWSLSRENRPEQKVVVIRCRQKELWVLWGQISVV